MIRLVAGTIPSMFFRPALRHPLLVLLALSPLCTIGADRKDSASAVVAHERFDATEPYLEGPDEAAATAVANHCLILDRRCLAFSTEQADVVLAAVPDNPEYWAAYAALLRADPLPVEHIDPANLPVYQGIIEGTTGWLRRELVTRRMTDAARLHEQVAAHRRRLALSNVLIEKMIFVATTDILLPAINMHMAYHETLAPGADEQLLDDMLKPLVRDELSLRQALAGELHYAAAVLEEQEDPSVQLDDLERVYGFVADRSEAGWEDFWRRGLDVLANVEVPSHFEWNTSWADYAAHVRYLEASLYVLRALREMYEGRISPGPPATPAPYAWSWRWEESSQTLCLDPGYLHASVKSPGSVCHQYLVAVDVAAYVSPIGSRIAHR